jgi:hypothetical protein
MLTCHQSCIWGCLKCSLQGIFPLIHIFNSLCLFHNSPKKNSDCSFYFWRGQDGGEREASDIVNNTSERNMLLKKLLITKQRADLLQYQCGWWDIYCKGRTFKVYTRSSGNSTVNNFFSARTTTLSPSPQCWSKIHLSIPPVGQSCSNQCNPVSSSRHSPCEEQHLDHF